MEEKWEGKVSTTLPSTKPHQIWPLFKDFFNIHKYFPTLSNSYGVHGTNGEVGCIRVCVGSSRSFFLPKKDFDSKINSEELVSLSKERLIAVDEVNKSLSYEIVESNIGLTSYVATVMISQGGDDLGNEGCVIEWSFTVDPVQGLKYEDMVKKYEVSLLKMAKAMEDSLITGS
ncbi:lachrymatory-factor synthase-like [Chenopodium quinoa]|uniref:lachrymatory-factor synthase-like n=1 Tax=Chenopodium quinoa TaxID=63459 RepID=UPI000B76EB26|nr:lachrymatory-factor synthase-like [Chenopodium quinoa]